MGVRGAGAARFAAGGCPGGELVVFADDDGRNRPDDGNRADDMTIRGYIYLYKLDRRC